MEKFVKETIKNLYGVLNLNDEYKELSNKDINFIVDNICNEDEIWDILDNYIVKELEKFKKNK